MSGNQGIKSFKTVSTNIIDNPTMTISINSLPNECLAMVFVRLPVWKILEIESVCEKWKEASVLAWSDVKKLPCPNTFAEYRFSSGSRVNLLRIIYRCGRYLKKLKIREECAGIIMVAPIHYWRNLVDFKFDMEYCPKGPVLSNSVFDEMEKLKRVKIINYHDFDGDTAEQDWFHGLTSQVEQLIFAAKFKHAILPETFKNALVRFDSPSYLTLWGWTIEKKIIRDISEKKMISHLRLNKLKLGNGTEMLTNLAALESLNLHNAEGGIGKLVRTLGHKCLHMKYLNISNCGLSRQALGSLGLLDKLEVLLAADTDIGNTILYELKNLTRVDFQGCPNVTDDGIMRVMKRSPELHSINVHGTGATIDFLLQYQDLRLSREKVIHITIRINVKLLHDICLRDGPEGSKIPRCLSAEHYHRVAEIILGPDPSNDNTDGTLGMHIVGTKVRFI